MAVTVTEEAHGSVKKIKYAWETTGAGAAAGTSTYAYDGALLRAVFIPGAGAQAPTDAFDVAINDEDGYDVLAGQGANLGSAVTTTVVASMGAVTHDKLAISVSNAGSATWGTAILYIR